MNETSSRFVDQLVLDKILSEKLRTVHHYPETGLQFPENIFDDWEHFRKKVEATGPGEFGFIPINGTGFTLNSLIDNNHPENQPIPVMAFKAVNPIMNMVLYHGLFEDNREIYQFLIQNLNRLGVTVYFSTLPFHYERVPSASKFSGEFFWSANFERTRSAFKQAVYDLHLLKTWIEQQSSIPLVIGGFSMGGAVALIYAALHQISNRIFALNPAVSLSEIVWSSPLCRTIKEDYLEYGYDVHALRIAHKGFEPVSYSTPSTPVDNIYLGYGNFDLVTSATLYRQLIRSWELKHHREYKCGHLNLLRVPRIANDLFSFGTGNE